MERLTGIATVTEGAGLNLINMETDFAKWVCEAALYSRYSTLSTLQAFFDHTWSCEGCVCVCV